ncbi:pentatricopeptide repeat-containing protein At1g55890, mitochondrial-like [Impatiens glandulifera]|uniref:pentatricopeptide repeat-containing protein At1g55890, mitochondrial-like n=1 Tax=Impatiens glandulifera TaxID=253017 RepID=UPI001FB0D521|nr:pentatricopeptide repeat-containing protein At1g55890, mitochondrial-like [Impatiens glandulifera]
MSSSLYRRLHGLFAASTAIAETGAAKSKVFISKTKASSLSPQAPRDKEKVLATIVKKFKKATDSKRFRHHSHNAYQQTVDRLARAQKFSYIEDILEHQKKYPDITTEGFVIRLISLYGKSGMFDNARKLFDEMPELGCQRTVWSFNALLDACVNSKCYDKIEELFHELPEKLSVKPDKVSCNTVIKAFCKMDLLDKAMFFLDEIQKTGIEPDLITFNTLIDAFYSRGCFSDAEKIWVLMEEKNISPNTRSYNPKLRALVADNKIEEAGELLEEMKKKGLVPDTYSYNALILGYCDKGELKEACRWYDEMLKMNLSANQYTFGNLGYCACKMGDFEFGLRICKDVIKSKTVVASDMFQKVVDGLVKLSKMDQAEELVQLGNSNNYFNFKLKLTAEGKEEELKLTEGKEEELKLTEGKEEEDGH